MDFKVSHIPFAQTNAVNALVTDYYTGNKNLETYYAFEPNLNGINEAIEKRTNTAPNRKLLHHALQKQYSNLPTHNEVKSNLSSLLNSQTFTVTTGHQLNLFTGPLYFIYKIASAIKLAQILNQQYSDKHFVPVYWMASEDHDFDEINHTYVFDKKINWTETNKGATGSLPITNIDNCLTQLKEALGANVFANEIINLISIAYQNKKNLAEATRALVNELFGQNGLVIIDASDKTLKQLFIPYLKADIFDSLAYKNVDDTTKQLSKKYKTQVFARSINLFYMIDGIRERIESEGDNYRVLNTTISFNKTEIEHEIESNPERFSPNVILRPVYQEVLLPNVAYIGGGAEVSYWLQYKKMFDAYNIFYPVVLLRNSFLWIEKSIDKKINQLKLPIVDLFLDKTTLVKRFLLQDDTISKFALPANHQIELVYNQLATAISNIDTTLLATAQSEKQKALNGIKILEDKALKAIKRKNETALLQIDTIKENLFPMQSLQERYFNFTMFYCKHGKTFIETILQNTLPIANSFTVITETDAKPTIVQ